MTEPPMTTGKFRKYFIAIVIPEPYKSEIESFKRQLFEARGLKGALRSPAHITLHRPFEFKSEREDKLISSLDTFPNSYQFDIELRNFDFFEPRVIFVAVEPHRQLEKLHRELTSYAHRNLSLFNESEDERGFHPHVTVAFRDLKRRLFPELKSQFEKVSYGARFAYQGFSLLRLEDVWKEIAHFPASLSAS